MTHIASIKQEAATLKQQIVQLLDWSDEQYARYQYEMGLLYLKIQIDNNGAVLERSKVYWGWWKYHWQLRDKAFLSDGIDQLNLSCRIQIYQALNDPYNMIVENELDHSYLQMLKYVRHERGKT